MRELGYIEGKNIQVEYRYVEGKSEHISSLVTELIQLKVDVLVSGAFSAIRVARRRTRNNSHGLSTLTIRSVGLVDSLARPGGNITGLARRPGPADQAELLELLTEAVPGIKRVGILFVYQQTFSRRRLGIVSRDYEAPARALRITAQCRKWPQSEPRA